VTPGAVGTLAPIDALSRVDLLGPLTARLGRRAVGRRAGQGGGQATSTGRPELAAANRQRIRAMRERLAAGEQVARMYQEPGRGGWSGKPRSPRTWSPSGRQPSAAMADLGSPASVGA
jgi:hypothetical protein